MCYYLIFHVPNFLIALITFLQTYSQCLLLNILINAIFFSLSEMKTHKMNTQESKERKFEEKVREKGSTVLIFTRLHLHFCFNYHQNLQVELKQLYYLENYLDNYI